MQYVAQRNVRHRDAGASYLQIQGTNQGERQVTFPFGGGLNGDPFEPYGIDDVFFEDGLEFVDEDEDFEQEAEDEERYGSL